MSSIEQSFTRHGIDVSRETIERLNIYERLLLKWQSAINLVGPATLDNVAERHFLDSAQIWKHIPDKNVRLADMGSGAGFPGLVLAVMGIADVHLIESDIRKATFLREVSRETGVKVTIHDKRVEDCRIENIDVITARALAPLKELLDMSVKLRTATHPFYTVFLKGAQHEDEVQKARKKWQFTLESFPSITDPASRILKVGRLDSLACGLK
jgi:16S rRNA (guanine527-N7)-methyltransferase